MESCLESLQDVLLISKCILSNQFQSMDDSFLNELSAAHKDFVSDSIEPYMLKGLLKINAVQLHSYQLAAIRWLFLRYNKGISCIVGDEMGLGKTLQTLAFLCCLLSKSRLKTLVLCPLSVTSTWEDQIKRFWPSCQFITYAGSIIEREEKRKDLEADKPLDLLLTTYEIFMQDYSFFKTIRTECLIVDEAQRLKSSKTKFYELLFNFSSSSVFKLLLTGVPIQNSLEELWSLLHFIMPKVFTNQEEDTSRFEKSLFENTKPHSIAFENESILSSTLDLFMLRRTAREIPLSIWKMPEVHERSILVPLTTLQRVVYLQLLSQRSDLIKLVSTSPSIEPKDDRYESAKRWQLSNLLMQLRKCANHPYLFHVVEPKPFSEGEHVCRASGKMLILKKLLLHFKKLGQIVLIFSGSTAMLDIIEDYLNWASISYERLDGSVQGDSRQLIFSKFNALPSHATQTVAPSAFLLSTHAGGVGLNLTAANVVIFIDSDWNPQNDLQAIARVARQGQPSAVTVIRLISEDTVDEVIVTRSHRKLQLAKRILGNRGSDASSPLLSPKINITDILFHSIDELINGTITPNPDNTKVLRDYLVEAAKQNYAYFLKNDLVAERLEQLSVEDVLGNAIEEVDVLPSTIENKQFPDRSIYEFEGVDYNAKTIDPSQSPALLVWKEATDLLATVDTATNNDTANQQTQVCCDPETRSIATDKYISYSVNDIEQRLLDFEGENEREHIGTLQHISGDASRPCCNPPWIILHSIDTSGNWPNGGFARALASHWTNIPRQYRLAKKNRDLHLGDLHLIPVEGSAGVGLDSKSLEHKKWVGLLVAHHRHDGPRRGALDMDFLEKAVVTLAKYLRLHKLTSEYTLHLPRLGESVGQSWREVENIFRRYIVSIGTEMFVYYFSRGSRNASNNPLQPFTSRRIVGSEGSHDESEGSHDESEGSHDESEASHDESEASHDESEASHDESEASHDESEASHHDSEVQHDRFEASHDESDASHDEQNKHDQTDIESLKADSGTMPLPIDEKVGAKRTAADFSNTNQSLQPENNAGKRLRFGSSKPASSSPWDDLSKML